MIGTELDGRYRIEAELGSGGVGTVYRAVQIGDGTPVAVKVLRAELASSVELRHRFARETRALTSLSHPNIVGVVDSGVSSDTAYLVMELLEGETLSARLKRGALSVGAALSVMRELLSALAFVHEQGLVHRDVKPANIFLEKTAGGERVRLLDFGLAKFLAPEAGGGPSLTRAGQVFGTPSYMAPEQIAGQQADPRTDVYASGIVLFEMLAGHVPFQGDASDVLRRHIMDDLPLSTSFPPNIPAGVLALLRAATAKTRAGRFNNAREMLEELERAARAQNEPAVPARSGPEAFAPTLTLEKPRSAEPPEDRATAPDPRPAPVKADNDVSPASVEPSTLAAPREGGGDAPVRASETVAEPSIDPRRRSGQGREKQSITQRVMRFGTTVAVMVSVTTAALAAVAIYLLVTPGREEERKVLETALGLPAPSASAGFRPKTLRSVKAWPSGSEEANSVEVPPGPVPDDSTSGAPSPPAPEDSDGPPEPGPPAQVPAPDEVSKSAAPSAPKGPVPSSPWAQVPAELVKLMVRANKTRGFDKHDMRDLHQYNGKHPTDPRGHILLARGYITRHWIKDAANEYAIALKVSDSTRGDPHLLPDLIRLVQFGSDQAAGLVVDTFGAAAAPAVDHALAEHPAPEVEERLQKLRAQLGT